MRRLRRLPLLLAAILGIALLALGAAAALLLVEDPLAALPRDDPSRVRAVEERREPSEGRTLHRVVLQGDAVGQVRLVVSLPDPLPPGRVPIVVVLGGLATGSDSLRAVARVAGDLGPNAYVGYDWPLPARRPAVAELVRRAPEFRRGVLSVPGQVDAIVAWASRQPWADADRVSLLGFSLGAFVVPAAQRLASLRGASVRATVLGYGGAPIADVIAGHPKAGPAWARPVLARGAGLLLRPVEPALHLPHLRGRFLVLEADADQLIARTAAVRMTALTPEPRTVIRMQGDHMGVGPGQRDLLRRVVEVSRAWLVEQGAADAARADPVARPPR